MQKTLLHDIIEWDIVNWSKAIPFWEKHIDLQKEKGLKCLELGSNKGGLSLWLAQKGFQVICSDLRNPKQKSEPKHKQYGNLPIKYEAINALDIPYENEFDIIIFKSILGGISRNENQQNKKLTIEQIYKALKPGGKLLFAENLKASKIHQFLRKHFIKWGAEWNYLKVEEINWLFENFNTINYQTTGFLGTFGRTEKQKSFLGKIDTIIDPLLKEKMKYILIGVAEK